MSKQKLRIRERIASVGFVVCKDRNVSAANRQQVLIGGSNSNKNAVRAVDTE